MIYARLRMMFDNFTLALLAVIALATFFPPMGVWETFFDGLTYAAIALLFFFHGAKLPRDAVIAGVTHWRLHLLIFAFTFLAFPIIGLLLKPFLAPLVNDNLYKGVLFLCALPATVQSAIAFTAMARGNVAAAVASASASSLIGILLTPVLVNLMIDLQGEADSTSAVVAIAVQLLLPFIGGQIARHWIGQWVEKHAAKLKYIDQGSILLVVFTAFGAAVKEQLWTTVSYTELAGLFVLCCILLAIVLWTTTQISRRLNFSTEDEITIVFCASKKSMATGVPMAKVIITQSSMLGPMLLPLLIFHQLQLMVCAVLAQRYNRREQAELG